MPHPSLSSPAAPRTACFVGPRTASFLYTVTAVAIALVVLALAFQTPAQATQAAPAAIPTTAAATAATAAPAAPAVPVLLDGALAGTPSPLPAATIRVNGTTYRYEYFVPARWDATRRWPVVLYLHGAGERAGRNTSPTDVGLGRALLETPDDFPFVCVIPRCANDAWWSDADMEKLALRALDDVMERFAGDPNRVYLTGMSMGGYGVWNLAMKHPKRFAAIAPICGRTHPAPGIPAPAGNLGVPPHDERFAELADRLGDVPTWVFHGALDPVVPVEESRQAVAALRSRFRPVVYTEYSKAEHEVWDLAYSQDGFWEWMLAKRRHH